VDHEALDASRGFDHNADDKVKCSITEQKSIYASENKYTLPQPGSGKCLLLVQNLSYQTGQMIFCVRFLLSNTNCEYKNNPGNLHCCNRQNPGIR
jgi:hypothetical protein